MLHTPLHGLSLRCLWSNLVTLPSRPRARYLHHLLPPPRVWDQSLIFRTYQKLEFSLALYCSFILRLYPKSLSAQMQKITWPTYSHFCYYMYVLSKSLANSMDALATQYREPLVWQVTIHRGIVSIAQREADILFRNSTGLCGPVIHKISK